MIERLAPWIAGLAYGGWSAFSNWEHGTQTALLAFLVQGAFAFTSTYVLGRIVAKTADKCAHIKNGLVQRLVVFTASSTFLWATPTALHLIAGTPNILMAMLPGLIVGHIYLFVITRNQLATA